MDALLLATRYFAGDRVVAGPVVSPLARVAHGVATGGQVRSGYPGIPDLFVPGPPEARLSQVPVLSRLLSKLR